MPAKQNRPSRKIMAILAGAAVIGVGAISTLATWNDSEWVNGLLSTSSFEVEQNTAADFAETAWVNEESNPGGTLLFTPNASALTPGDTVYAAVALRTTADSDAASVTLQQAVAAAGTTPDLDVWNALDLRVTTSATAFTCDADGITAGTEIVSGKLASVGASTETQSLAANSGSVQYYCFEISLPAELAGSEEVQGQSAQPAWEFQAVSTEA